MDKKKYLIRIRQPDGSWVIDEERTFTKREAEKLMQFNRIIGGISSQLWSYDEWMGKHSKSAPLEANTIEASHE